MCAHGRKNISAVEGGGNSCADHPTGVGDLANVFDAVAVLDQCHQAVIGQHEELTTLRFHHHRLARTANAGIDDCHEYCSGREVGRGAEQKHSAISNRKCIDLVSEIDNAEIGRDPVHDSFTQRHGIVDDSKIRHEYNGGRRVNRGLLREKSAGVQKDEKETEYLCRAFYGRKS